MKVCFETFGCRLNKAEALQMEAEYLAKGWELTEKHSNADLFVVRGCSVTARAQADCEKLIAHLRRRYPTTPLRVCGCLEERSRSKVKVNSGRSNNQTIKQSNNQTIPQSLPTRTARAYLKVQDGCSGKCTFCIVPKFRGSSVSVPFTELLDRARRFIDAGYHEIVVTGCNLSLYASEGKRLPDLLSALAEIAPPPATAGHQPSTSNLQPSFCRIRLGSLEPGSCALETVHAIAEHANVCRFLHIPVQSGSNRILAAMKRPYLVRDVDAVVTTAVKLLPNLGLGCDLMTGFPDETELDYEATKALLKRLPFNNAHIFTYSERPGTPAAGFGGGVSMSIRSQRAHRLARHAKNFRKKFAHAFLGKTVEIIVEDKNRIVGWTGEYLRCEATGTAPRKSLVRIRVTDVKDDRLSGQVIAQSNRNRP